MGREKMVKAGPGLMTTISVYKVGLGSGRNAVSPDYDAVSILVRYAVKRLLGSEGFRTAVFIVWLPFFIGYCLYMEAWRDPSLFLVLLARVLAAPILVFIRHSLSDPLGAYHVVAAIIVVMMAAFMYAYAVHAATYSVTLLRDEYEVKFWIYTALIVVLTAVGMFFPPGGTALWLWLLLQACIAAGVKDVAGDLYEAWFTREEKSRAHRELLKAMKKIKDPVKQYEEILQYCEE